MKKLFVSLVALTMATMSYAQNTLVATLTHGDEISMFYGNYALRDAHNAAQSGDVINLSGGTFQSVDITKGITLRGTGIDDATPTYIANHFTINIPTNDTIRLSMEGIRFTASIDLKETLNNPYFVKCVFKELSCSGNPSIKNAMFANCKITDYFYLRGNSKAQFVNCYVKGFDNRDENNTSATFVNSVIFINPKKWYGTIDGLNCINSLLANCIIYVYEGNYDVGAGLPSSDIATNCLSVGFSQDFFKANASNRDNQQVSWNEYDKVFKTFVGKNYSDSEQFELTDEGKTKYLGTDGTEVGMYGGMLPYNSTPSYPQITKMNVANKTTADGKLSVEIEVSATE